jgi:CheY-like chemotaxis protein
VMVTASVTPWAEVALDRPAMAPDDRGRLVPDDPRLLLLADERASDVAVDVAHELGFKVLTASDAAAALETARRYAPDSVLLMPGVGVDVLELLQDLKARPTTRHLPVYVGVPEEQWRTARNLGAAGRLPVALDRAELSAVLEATHRRRERPARTVMVVSPDERRRHDVIALIGGDQIETVSAQTGRDALAILGERSVDCIVCDLASQSTDGFTLLDQLASNDAIRDLPVVLPHTLEELDRDQQERLDALADAVTVRATESPQELYAISGLYLHRAVASRSEERTRREGRFEQDPVLLNRRVLIVDDDVRNVFAVSAALEAQGMAVFFADNGRDGIAQLEQQPDVDLVLMDIMMPEMDGYETMRAIRARPALATLPIIALTAKALTGDREKAIAAGASDYITKPVDIDRLLSVIRGWLDRDEAHNADEGRSGSRS